MVCRSVAGGESRATRKPQLFKRLPIARGVARALLTVCRDHLDEHMIAQPILTHAAAAKPQAQQQQQQQQAPNAGFQSLLSMTDSSLTDLAQNTGASAAQQQPANTNKPKNTNDPTATPYVAAPNQPSAPPVSPSDGKQAAADGNSIANAALVPANDPTAAAADPNAAGASNANGTGSGNSNGNSNGNSTAFGADALNARIVAGAPIYASQPTAAMATVPAHLLDAANAHPLPGEPVGKPGDPVTGKASTDANAALPPSPAAATPATPPQLLPNHPAVTGASANGSSSDNSGNAAPAADAGTATATNSDPSTPSTSLLAQPNAPQTAPVQVDAAVHTAAPYVPVGEQVALNLKQAVAADNNEIRITLKPASLGTIDVKLNVGQDGRINAVISADRSDTLNMLKQDAGTLQQSLRDAGLNADSSSLSFNLRGDAQSFAQNWSQGDGGAHGGGGTSYSGGANSPLLTADTVTPTQRVHSGALDIEV